MKPTIWQAPIDIDRLNALRSGNMLDHLDIVFTRVGPDFLSARMPVDRRTIQPFGQLHGGASVVLAETLASMAGLHCIAAERATCVGIEINANHMRAVREGFVLGTTRPLHLGTKTHVWEVHITDSADRLVCVSRITLAIIPQSDSQAVGS